LRGKFAKFDLTQDVKPASCRPARLNWQRFLEPLCEEASSI
jgi:hypothetical protein